MKKLLLPLVLTMALMASSVRAQLPTPTPIEPLPSTDLTYILNMMTVYQTNVTSQLTAIKTELDKAASDISTLKSEVESQWSKYVGPILKYGAVLVAGIIAKWKLLP